MTVLDVVLLAAPLAVVPAAFRLLPVRTPHPAVMVACAAPLVAAFARPRDPANAILCAGWVGVVLLVAGRTLTGWLARPALDAATLGTLAAVAYLCGGAASIVATRTGTRVLGWGEPLVEITAVHYHYAGFAATLIAVTCLRGARRTPTAGLACTVVASPVVASGFAVRSPVLQIAGALLMTAGVWIAAALTLGSAREASGAARVLLVVSGVSPFVPMALAISWALAQAFDVPALTIPQMARVHGTMNAVGFVGCGLAGRLLDPASVRSCLRDDGEREGQAARRVADAHGPQLPPHGRPHARPRGAGGARRRPEPSE